MEENMTEPVIAQKTPIEVELESGKSYWWCACGKSASQPFCDGSHSGTGLSPVEYVAPRSRKIWFCACKKTKKGPFCDGAHNSL